MEGPPPVTTAAPYSPANRGWLRKPRAPPLPPHTTATTRIRRRLRANTPPGRRAPPVRPLANDPGRLRPSGRPAALGSWGLHVAGPLEAVGPPTRRRPSGHRASARHRVATSCRVDEGHQAFGPPALGPSGGPRLAVVSRAAPSRKPSNQPPPALRGLRRPAGRRKPSRHRMCAGHQDAIDSRVGATHFAVTDPQVHGSSQTIGPPPGLGLGSQVIGPSSLGRPTAIG